MSKFSRRQVIGGAGSAILVGGAGAAKAAPNTTSNLTADVCIVGAGFAGLSAALRLKQAGASVVVLEARGQVGGRSWTVTMKDGGWVDWGGQWVGSSQERFYALIKEMGCETYPSPNFGKTLQRSIFDTNEYYRIDEDKDEAFPGSDLLKGIYKRLDAIADTVDVNAPWAHPDGKLLDSMTFAEWLRQNVQHDGARQFAATEVGSVPSASPEEISVLHLAWLIKACHGIGELFGDAQADRLIGGTQLVARRVAERLKDEIKFNQPVRRIQWNDKGAVVQSDSIAVTARRVIVCVPPSLAGAIEYAPALTTNRMQVTQRWPQGLVIKVSMVYSAPFWRDDGLNGTSYDHISVMGETADSSNPPESFQGRHPHRLRLYRQRAQGRAAAGRGAQAHPARRGRQALRAEGARARELSRVELDRGAVDARLLHRLPHARRDDAVRQRGARSGRPDPLGRHRDLDRLAVLHRRRDPLRRAGGGGDQEGGLNGGAFGLLTRMTPAARSPPPSRCWPTSTTRRRPAADALKDWGLAHRFAGSGDRAAIAGLSTTRCAARRRRRS